MEGYMYLFYMCLSLLLISECRSSDENCHVNPECSCSRENMTKVYCDLACNAPKFSASSVQFAEVIIRGTRDTRYIQHNSFRGLITNKLTIHRTGISDIPCNAWRGLEETLTSLTLDNNYLTSVPACSFQTLANLQNLSLWNNNIKIIQKEAFVGLSSLRQLRLGRNKVEIIEANAFYSDGSVFRGLESLTELSLEKNRLSILHPRVFAELKELRSVDLDDNNITSLDNTLFQDLVNLTTLSMRNNRIGNIPDSLFQYNTELDTLDLAGNSLSTLHRNLFRTNSKLRDLFLDNNQLTSLSSEVFKKLGMISLRGNNIFGFGSDLFGESPNSAKFFKDLTNLHTLDLSQNNLERIDSNPCSNCPKLYNLNFSQNHIYFMHEMSLTNYTALTRLNLDRNNLNQSSWKWLVKVINKVTTIISLDLSHNPVGDLPPELFNSNRYWGDLVLRNCSLNTAPDVLKTTYVQNLDLSSNNLKGFNKTIYIPRMIDGRASHYFWLYISNNYLRSFNMRLTSGSYSHTAQLVIDLNHNYLQIPITVTVETYRYSGTGSVKVSLLDLSYNHIQNVTQFPMAFSTRGVTLTGNRCNNHGYVSVQTINLSNNAISYISRKACLGFARRLDLSNNQIQRLSPDVVAQLQNSVYFSGNIFSCECSAAWLRNSSFPQKLHSARCQSPPSVKGFLVYCYPLNGCPVNTTITIADITTEICEQDLFVELSNLTVTSNVNVTKVAWAIAGPGTISGYKLELREVKSSVPGKTLLILPDMLNVTVDNLKFNHTYNICLSADLNGRRASNELCKEVTISHVSGVETSVSGAETFSVGADVVIGLSVALALCLITVIALAILVLLYRRKTCHQTGGSEEKRTARTNTYHNRMKSAENMTSNEIYDDLDDKYEN